MQQDSTTPPLGSTIGGRHRLDALIGSGGMASVFLALDTQLGRRVAVKVFRSEVADAAALARQRSEIELLASLNHPALVTLFDAGTSPVDSSSPAAHTELAYFVMELVEGPDLRSSFAENTLSPAQLAHVGADIAEALHYVHDRGIVHRDVKPANVLVAPARLPGLPLRGKLSDFGIARLIDSARLTSTGTLVGTASYLSPEQALGRPVGAASDIYSLGLVLLEGISGERAFPGGALESALARTSRDPEIPTGIDPLWAQLLGAMTASSPELRPPPAAVATALRKLETSTAATALLPAPVSAQTEQLNGPTRVLPTAVTARLPAEQRASVPTEQPVKRRKLLLGASAGLLVLCAALVAIFLLVVLPSISTNNDEPPQAPVVYPAVPGQLGEHLGELQEAVAP